MTDDLARLTVDEVALLGALYLGQRIVYSRDGDMAWLNGAHPQVWLGERPIVGLRAKGYTRRVVENEDDDNRDEYDVISDAGRGAARRLSSEDGVEAVARAPFVYSSVCPRFKDDSNEVDHLEIMVHATFKGTDQAALYRDAQDACAKANAALATLPGGAEMREAAAALEKARAVLRAIVKDKKAGVHYAGANAACHEITAALAGLHHEPAKQEDGK